MTDSLRIGELVLRVPGIGTAEARRLVDEVLARIGAGLPEGSPGVDLDRVELKLALPRGIGRDALAERIARAVLDQLRPGDRRG